MGENIKRKQQEQVFIKNLLQRVQLGFYGRDAVFHSEHGVDNRNDQGSAVIQQRPEHIIIRCVCYPFNADSSLSILF